MKKKYSLLLLIFSFTFEVFSQGQGDTWIFGDSAGIHFVNGQPIAINSSILSMPEMSASISDQQGNLLFYCGPSALSGSWDCCTYVWDRNNQLMLHGNNLNSGGTNTQGSLIVPMPNDTMKYYIFNIGFPPTGFYALYYSIVDMAQNGGYGDVDVIHKNVLVCDTFITEKMIGIKHANGRDWWVINHKWNSNTFYKYIVTPYGINGPFTQSIGDSVTWDGYLGQMATNRDGTKLVLAAFNGDLQLYDFDRCNGLLSNFLQLGDPVDTGFNSYYGCSFSPESSVLYVSTPDSLFQFDLTAINIKASKTLLVSYPSGMQGGILIGQHQIAPDGKIYIAMSNESAFTCDSLVTYLSVINNPNMLGVACSFTPFSFPLANCSEVYLGLPNMPNYNLGSVVGSVCDTVTAVEEIRNNYGVSVYPNPVKDVCVITAKQFSTFTLSLYDITGRTLTQQPFNTKAELNLTTLTPGIYIVEIKDEQGHSAKAKVVKE